MQIGAQLYTVRDFCKTEKKFAETLFERMKEKKETYILIQDR